MADSVFIASLFSNIRSLWLIKSNQGSFSANMYFCFSFLINVLGVKRYQNTFICVFLVTFINYNSHNFLFFHELYYWRLVNITSMLQRWLGSSVIHNWFILTNCSYLIIFFRLINKQKDSVSFRTKQQRKLMWKCCVPQMFGIQNFCILATKLFLIGAAFVSFSLLKNCVYLCYN